MTSKNNTNNTNIAKAFTLIEAMIVLFIIGLLSLVAAIGYGNAARQKLIEQSARRVATELSRVRNYAVFGQGIEGTYPCGYGMAIGKDNREIKDIYTSRIDRLQAMDSDKTCDELIKGQAVDLSEITVSNTDDLLLGDKIILDKIIHSNNGNSSGSNCLVVLFSAPKGNPYYYASNDSSCPPANPAFQSFSGSPNYFLATLKVDEGSSSNQGDVKIYPSGNTEVIQE